MQAEGSTVSVNLQVPAGTKASGLQQLLAAANGVVAEHDGRVKAGPLNRKERFWANSRQIFMPKWRTTRCLGPYDCTE